MKFFKLSGITNLKFLHISPLSLADKCRIEFGAAILFILAIALLIPYHWMNKLTEKAALDSGRAIAYLLDQRHFQLDSIKGLPPLDEKGSAYTQSPPPLMWIRFGVTDTNQLPLSDEQKIAIADLKASYNEQDRYWISWQHKESRCNYVRIIRATENCLSCHSASGTASAFTLNKDIGVILVQTPARELSKTISLNRLWIFMAGLLAGTGAVITFYVIVQRVILRPVRQLRALANNVAEGNLDVRSSIKTRDEYERLAEAFNKMLDRLQESQEKLRKANRSLDAKIAELSESNIELFRANKVKSEFLANMSHEFRTPLNAIIGFADIFREKASSLEEEKAKRYAENILSSGRQLLNMINDLLELAKVEAGKMEVRMEKTSIPELCRGLAAFFSPLIDQKQIELRIDIDDTMPLTQTDPGKIQQILYNIMSNAIKFTPEKGVIEIKAAMASDKIIRIIISDTGPGIAEADQARIFEKFRQIDGSITRKTPGTGLGLAISKELAGLLAADIGLQSTLGKGSKFWVDVPVTEPTEAENKPT